MGPQQGRQPFIDTVQHPLPFRFFLQFDGFPVGQDFIAVGYFNCPEYMGMTLNQFIRHAVNDILQRKHSLFFRHTGMEYYLHQDIPQFFFHAVGILVIHSFQKLIAFFNQIGTNRVKILFPIPGTPSRFTKHLHHICQRTHIKLRFVF